MVVDFLFLILNDSDPEWSAPQQIVYMITPHNRIIVLLLKLYQITGNMSINDKCPHTCVQHSYECDHVGEGYAEAEL